MRILAILAAMAALFAAVPAAQAAFPGGNAKIAFTDALSDGSSTIHVINPDGSAEANISSVQPTFSDSGGVWSPDGRTLAFTSNRDSIFYEIYTMSADGSDVNRITNNDRVAERSPSWSPDGTRIVYSGRCPDGSTGLCVINADGSGGARIPNTLFTFDSPAWSPDGNKIAFIRRRDRGADLHTINPDGSGLKRLTFLPDFPEQCRTSAPCSTAEVPDWSPDGSTIAFAINTLACDPSCAYKADIALINRDGTGLRSLTSAPLNEAHTFPAWSPEGDEIAFISGCPLTCPAGSAFDLYVMSSSGSDVRRLTNDPELELAPDWQPTFKNSAEFCRVERERLGESDFRRRYSTNENDSNAFGKCVSANARK